MQNISKSEEKILSFWQKNKIFEKSVERNPASRPYVFYDGPPFATGLPHYGHIVASLMKDVVPRYWTMKGFRVERKWGWDCHGLPIENLIEKELNLKSRKDIENYGIDKFNKACHSAVLKYAKEWQVVVERMGRWVDMDNDYKTMDISYMESVWWVFKSLWEKGLIYQGHKAMHVCPRCETPLSNFEVTQGYKDVKDLSVTVKFKIKNPEKIDIKGDLYILAWTTTPWTLPGNVLLAVGKNIDYKIVNYEGENLVVAEDREKEIFKSSKQKPIKKIKGKDLIGLEYEPLFPYFKDTKNAFRVVAGDFVTTEDGTGVVHIAPAFGEDDYSLGKKENIGWVQHVSMDGRFTKEVEDFKGIEVKPKENPTETDIKILKWLHENKKLFSKESYMHSYPHCWRCDSPLINYATSSWFIKVTEIKNQLLKNNKLINWVPEHIKEGRFGKWLEGARDWAVSRNRFWGTPLPVWQSEDGENICVSSVQELESLSGIKITDIHKHLMDKIVIKKNGKEYKKIPEVLDCWFESGSMPYGQMHYPFENKEKFEKSFPAEFIAEGQDQTRGWFYTLHVLATALTEGKNKAIPKKESVPAFKNVIVNGIVLAEDGKKMSKRLQNYPDPMDMLEKYGADAMRYYLVSSPVMYAENLNFSEKDVRELYNKLIGTLRNVADMYLMYAKKPEKIKSNNVLDRWILAKFEILKKEVEENMNTYKLAHASRPILDFVTDLSQWYVRRSRARIKASDKEALATLFIILKELCKISAPFIPFIAEDIYLSLNIPDAKKSVHLEDWPKNKKLEKSENQLLSDMQAARDIVEQSLALRAEAGIKVKQPLQELKIKNQELNENLLKVIADEVNVKNVLQTKGKGTLKVELDTTITPELKKEGYAREIVRGTNALRKSAGLTPKDKITLYVKTDDNAIATAIKEQKDNILRLTISKELKLEKKKLKNSSEIKLDGKTVWLGLE